MIAVALRRSPARSSRGGRTRPAGDRNRPAARRSPDGRQLEMIDSDRVAAGERGGDREHVLELAHVARPGLREQARPRLAGQPRRRAQGAEGIDQRSAARRRRGRAAAASRRSRRANESKDRAGSSPARPSRERSRWVAASTRTSTRRAALSPSRRISPSCSTRSSMPCAEQRKIADLVEEDRAAVSGFEHPFALAVGAGERAAHMAEEIGEEQGLGEGGAVDGDERPAGAGAAAMETPGRELLAGAALAQDQHRQVTGRQPVQAVDRREQAPGSRPLSSSSGSASARAARRSAGDGGRRQPGRVRGRDGDCASPWSIQATIAHGPPSRSSSRSARGTAPLLRRVSIASRRHGAGAEPGARRSTSNTSRAAR